jgi:hypothetical protein
VFVCGSDKHRQLIRLGLGDVKAAVGRRFTIGAKVSVGSFYDLITVAGFIRKRIFDISVFVPRHCRHREAAVRMETGKVGRGNQVRFCGCTIGCAQEGQEAQHRG